MLLNICGIEDKLYCGYQVTLQMPIVITDGMLYCEAIQYQRYTLVSIEKRVRAMGIVGRKELKGNDAVPATRMWQIFHPSIPISMIFPRSLGYQRFLVFHIFLAGKQCPLK